MTPGKPKCCEGAVWHWETLCGMRIEREGGFNVRCSACNRAYRVNTEGYPLRGTRPHSSGPAVHYDAGTANDAVACGQANAFVSTVVPEDVECRRCHASRAFRERKEQDRRKEAPALESWEPSADARVLARTMLRAFDGPASSFNEQIFLLFPKADPANKRRLERGFPAHAKVYADWKASESESAFRERYKVWPRGRRPERS